MRKSTKQKDFEIGQELAWELLETMPKCNQHIMSGILTTILICVRDHTNVKGFNTFVKTAKDLSGEPNTKFSDYFFS